VRASERSEGRRGGGWDCEGSNTCCAHRFVGAALSTLDLITDVQVIVDYLNTPGKETFAHQLTIMVGTCLLFQLLCVWVQRRKGPKVKMAQEMLIVLTALKPGLDAYKVAKGEEQSVGSIMDPATEHCCTKCFEMVSESIPGWCSPQLLIHFCRPGSNLSAPLPRQVAYCSSTCS
jgi:hypothetical protein